MITNECEPVIIVDSDKQLLDQLYSESIQSDKIIKYVVKAPFNGIIVVVQYVITLEYDLIHLDDQFNIVTQSTIGLPIQLMTSLTAVTDGIICTGLCSSRFTDSGNELVVVKFNKHLDIMYYRQYETLFTDEDPIVTVDRSGVIICSGIKQRMNDGSITTYLIRLDKDLIMRCSTIYDTTNTINITALSVTDDRKIVGVGSIFTDELFMKQTAIVIVFDRNDLQYMYDVRKENTWIDDVKEYTHIKDAALLGDGSLVCVGLTLKGGKQRATVWRFSDLLDPYPIRSIMDVVKVYAGSFDNNAFLQVVSCEEEFVGIGLAYNRNGKQSLFISRFDTQQLDLIENTLLDDVKVDSIININNKLIRVSDSMLSDA